MCGNLRAWESSKPRRLPLLTPYRGNDYVAGLDQRGATPSATPANNCSFCPSITRRYRHGHYSLESLCEAQEVGGQIIIFLFCSKCTFQPSYPQSPHKSRYSRLCFVLRIVRSKLCNPVPSSPSSKRLFLRLLSFVWAEGGIVLLCGKTQLLTSL